MIKALIVDDETRARKTIASLLKINCPDVNVCAEAADVATAVAKINEHNPEIVFLDIKLQDETGFDLLKKYSTLPFKVIFISAFEEYAVKAFKFSALDYILKPVQAAELKAAVENAKQVIAKEKFGLRLESFFQNIESFKKGEAKRIIVKNSDAIHVIEVKDLIRCEGEKNYTTFYQTNGNRITVTTTLKDYEDLLTPYGFIRTHQGHLVNSAYIERLEKKDGALLIMKDKTEIPVSTRKKEEVIKALDAL
ncbi:MAG: LytTR family DNA-binding domain-containing protein [Bacteroidota bacterium]|nr:LytTR family DNA-binding domain-containing protein [Bacteroidota bacterium]